MIVACDAANVRKPFMIRYRTGLISQANAGTDSQRRPGGELAVQAERLGDAGQEHQRADDYAQNRDTMQE
jgi:hypothetical protein